MSEEGILIVGGYGVVGSRIAADLASDFPRRVIVAGPNPDRAGAAAATIGHGASGRTIDVTVPSSLAAALEDVSVVVSCIDQPGRALLRAVIKHGLGYTDITPHLTELGRGSGYDEIDAAATASGARVVLGAGLVPGISNVMARALVDTLGSVDAIETSLLLSASDTMGPASFTYFLRELSMPFEVHVDGTDRPGRAFSEPRDIEFPPPIGLRRAYLFPFSDQVLYPRTMGARTVLSRLALEPQGLARVLVLLIRSGAVRLVSLEGVRRTLMAARRRRRRGGDAQFALRVEVTSGQETRHSTLVARVQANAAAVGAAGVVRSLLEAEVAEAGAWMPEQIIDPARFFSYLAQRGLSVGLPRGL